MPDKDPTAWSIATWILACSMAFGSGAINWWARVKQGKAKVFGFFELVGEMFTSGMVGLGVFMTLAAFDQPAGLCAAAAGISGHMATRLLFAIERAVERRINDFAGVKNDPEPNGADK